MKQSKIVLFLLSFVSLSMSSCLKEHMQNIDADNSYEMVEFANTGSNVAGATSTYPGFNIDLGTLGVGESAPMNINASYSGPNTAPEDITVNFELDQATLDTYNTENGTSYVIPPTSVFTLPASVTIKKGARIGQAQATINRSADFNFADAYALPLKITTVSHGGVSSNFGKAIFAFGIRNIYDGVYTVTGTLTDAAAATITGDYPFTAELHTLGPNSVYFDSHPILSGGSSSSYGEFAPVFTIDPATNKIISVVNKAGQPSPDRKRAAEIVVTGINAYDPATKSFDVTYIMSQGGAPRTTFVEHYKYEGAR